MWLKYEETEVFRGTPGGQVFPLESKARFGVASEGKTSEKEDRYTSHFLELTLFRKIIQAITFDSSDPAFAGEMIMEVSFEQKGTKTKVNIIFRNIPPGIRPEDNEAGTQLSLEKLKRYVKENIDT